jgi:hypothetical protein
MHRSWWMDLKSLVFAMVIKIWWLCSNTEKEDHAIGCPSIEQHKKKKKKKKKKKQGNLSNMNRSEFIPSLSYDFLFSKQIQQ